MSGKRKPLISASILGADLANLADAAAAAAEGGCDEIHFDVMDGQFVGNISMGLIVLKAVARHASIPMEAHMMVVDPGRFVEEYAEAGCRTYTVHVEACGGDAAGLAGRIRAAGMRPGIAINPDTPESALEGVLEHYSRVLVMTVHPGASGQGFLTEVMPKMRRIRERLDGLGGEVLLAVDGGVKAGTIGEAARAGAELFVSATGIYGHAGGAAAAVAELREAAASA